MTSHLTPPPPPTAFHGWSIETSTGDAGPFHQRDFPTPSRHEVWIHHVQRPALVLGSTQSEGTVDAARARIDGVEVCRRRSGGGIVPLIPGQECWIDVIVPRSSALWDDDVGRAFAWLGRVWADVLSPLVSNHADGEMTAGRVIKVHAGPLRGGSAGKLVCFASLGPGEVVADGRKVVGISQRRTRAGARFQCIAVGRWNHELLDRYLQPDQLAAVGLIPHAMAVGLAADVWPEPKDLAELFCRHLPNVGDG